MFIQDRRSEVLLLGNIEEEHIMYLKKIEISNFRLWKNANIDLEKQSTVIVGKNNTGKTSLMDLIQLLVNNNRNISFDDYPLGDRKILYQDILAYLNGEKSYEELTKSFLLTKITMYVDYSLENDDENLGALSPFIIDTDNSITEAKIEAIYSVVISKEAFDSIFTKEILNDADKEERIKEILGRNFSSLIKLNFFAVNPSDNNKRRKIDFKEFEELFHIFAIKAERNMNESESLNETPLRSIISSVFKPELDNASDSLKDKRENLKKYCDEANLNTEKRVNDLLKVIVEDFIQFGYPSAEDQKLFAKSNIKIEEQIKNSVDLCYRNTDTNETLPSGYNGLGYKNLIKIQLELIDYAKQIKEYVENSIPIVFIEEPESHMHPQMQQKFIEYIDNFCKNNFGKDIQIIITTHSSHIVNSTEFEKIRYVTKSNDSVLIKNLTDYCHQKDNNKVFLEKYLTLNKCDLFFADKAILIEGTAERLLIPNMIEKLACKGELRKDDISLKSQYYTLIEVGGAYAYKFIPLLRFLKIPTLIITDIDSVNAARKSCFVKDGKNTSNATINYWFSDILKKKREEYSFNDIKSLETKNKTSDKIHIEYQVEENGLCGRSLEEAIKNSNRELFGLTGTVSEEDLEYNPYSDGSKTDFAMNLIFENTKQNYIVPKYIADGLKWLDLQASGR